MALLRLHQNMLKESLSGVQCKKGPDAKPPHPEWGVVAAPEGGAVVQAYASASQVCTDLLPFFLSSQCICGSTIVLMRPLLDLKTKATPQSRPPSLVCKAQDRQLVNVPHDRALYFIFIPLMLIPLYSPVPLVLQPYGRKSHTPT